MSENKMIQIKFNISNNDIVESLEYNELIVLSQAINKHLVHIAEIARKYPALPVDTPLTYSQRIHNYYSIPLPFARQAFFYSQKAKKDE